MTPEKWEPVFGQGHAQMTKQPLAGLLVLDFSTLLPGPLATLMLAEAGAEVIKIERPGGEDMRRLPPVIDGEGAAFAMLNRGKQVLTLDLKSGADRARLMPLIGRADILIEQFRPGVMARLGLGYDDLHALNPWLIYCSISGYGQSGPRAGEAEHDINYIGNTGLLDLQPGPVEAPVVPPVLAADIGGGSFPAMINILLALRTRDQSGQGSHIDIAMTDTMFTFAWYALALGQASGRFPSPVKCLWPVARRAISFIRPRMARSLPAVRWSRNSGSTFTALIGLAPELVDDRRDPKATRDAVAKLIAARTSDEWKPLFAAADCCVTVVTPLEEAIRDPHFVERGLFARPDRDRIGNDNGGAATADRAAVPRQARRKEGALDRLAAHQARLRLRRRDAFAHDGAAQRADLVEHIKPEPAQPLYGQEVGEQRAIEQIDGDAARGDIATAQRVVGRQHVIAANVIAGALGFDRRVRRWSRHRAGRGSSPERRSAG